MISKWIKNGKIHTSVNCANGTVMIKEAHTGDFICRDIDNRLVPVAFSSFEHAVRMMECDYSWTVKV